ncbi:lysozyme inhibitor LprI family protein [Thermomonas paludicola]|uniref:lysozyme inhibitor LprI family protein n=1 Tax=Thermomonas paludicola TaxID=2884874 RepID=UPI002113DB00|nr:lysozyme inhibitor LprI family protein [Thermomonas paludicola]
MLKIRWLLAALFALPGPGVAQVSNIVHAPLPAQAESPDWNWADDSARITQGPQFAGSKAICGRLRGLEPPPGDWPDAATAATLSECDSEALYYGIGMPVAPVRARQCALLETQRADGNQWPFSGTAMLMTIYANGVGADRNLDLATALACRIGGAAYESHGRVSHLQRLAAEAWAGSDFDYCDDITSGMAGGFCAIHAASMADARRSDTIDGMSRGWTLAERKRLDELLAAMQAFATASSENEVDLGGSGRVGFMQDREQEVSEALMRWLAALQANRFPAASAQDGRLADARMNRVYRQIMATRPAADGRISEGTVVQSGVREAQRAWLRYRDAFVRFVAVKYPQVSTASINAGLTRQRTAFLEQFAPQP